MTYKNTISIILLLLSAMNICADTLEEKAQAKISALNTLITQAEAQGISVLHEKTAIRTAEVFLEYANWDEANEDINASYFALVSTYKQDSLAMAQELPDFERQDIIDLLDETTVYLNKLINKECVRTPSPNVDWSQVSLEGDQLSYLGKPVFLNDYTWKPETSELLEYHGQLDGFFIRPPDVINAEGEVRASVLEELSTKPSGRLGFIFINHKAPPAWSLEKYGEEFQRPTDTYTNYDIDNPGAREMMGYLLSATVPLMVNKKYSELGYMLCNEPHFYCTETNEKWDWASGPVTEYTFDKFRAWLLNKHTTITELNSLWGTSFASFADISIDIPIDTEITGTAMWYDWTRFNRYRVTQWYTDLKDSIQHYDADGIVNLKIMPNLWSDNKRGHGIDLEKLSEMSGIMGNDASIAHSMLFGAEQEWEEHYAYEWRELCMAYDFMKSICPDKAILNSENHFLSTGKSRDLYQDPIHAQSTFWLGHMFGLSVSQTWLWARQEDGSIRNGAGKGYAGSNNQQPRMTNAIHSTLLDMNAFPYEMMAMQRQAKPIRIFHSETSAINKTTHMDDEYELYKALVFDGVPIGFVTQSILEKQDAQQWEVIVIYKTEYITDTERQALQNYLDNGGTIITDNISLKKDEYGRSMEALTASKGIIYRSSNITAMKILAMRQVSDQLPEITVSEENDHNADLCLWKCVKNEVGNNVISAVNLGNVATTLDITLNNAQGLTKYKDLIRGVYTTGQPTLQPKEVYFVEIEGNTRSDLTDNEKLKLEVFPNPSTGLVTIKTPNTMLNSINIYDLSGKQVYTSTTGTKQLDLNHLDRGHYILQVKSNGNTTEEQLIIR